MQTGTTPAGWMGSRRVAVFTSLFALVCLMGEAVYCWRTPTAYFDTLAYVALAEGQGAARAGAEGGPNDFVIADAECSLQVPGKRAACDVVGSLGMTRVVEAYSAAEFAQFLRFYTVKPLYVGLGNELHRGFRRGSFVGLRMISVGSFLLIGLTSWAWLREHLPVAVAPVVAFWMTAYGPVLGLGKDLLPDGLSTALLLAGTYLVLYRSKAAGVVLLGLAVLARPDALLFAGCLAGAWVLERSGKRRWTKLGAVALGCAVVSFVLGKATGAVSWAVLFRRSFFELIPPERFASAHVSVPEYAQVMASNGVRVVMFCLPMAMFLGLLALVGSGWNSVPPGLKPLAQGMDDVRAEARSLQGSAVSLRAVVLAGFVAVVLRVLLQPGVEERYYVWFYLVCAIAAACVMADRFGVRAVGEDVAIGAY